MLITKAEFARRMKVTPGAVGVAVRRGRISATPEGWIDFERASIEWEMNRKRMRFSPPSPPIAAPDPDAVEFAQIAIWLAWHFGPRERLTSALECWLALFPQGISVRPLLALLDVLKANLDRLANDHE